MQVQNSLSAQFFRSPILAALLHGTSAVCVSQTLWRYGIFTQQGGHPVRHWAVEQSSYFDTRLSSFCVRHFVTSRNANNELASHRSTGSRRRASMHAVGRFLID